MEETMSGIIGMNEWERSNEASRTHIENVSNGEAKIAGMLNRECSHPRPCHFEHRGAMWCSSCGKELPNMKLAVTPNEMREIHNKRYDTKLTPVK
jgi:uncharacterized Zn finger protein (UPF0148 family)